MKHYADSIEFCSPVVQKVLGDPKGVVTGIDNLRDYFSKQLKKFSTLHFQLLDVFTSPQSIVLYYKINRALFYCYVAADSSPQPLGVEIALVTDLVAEAHQRALAAGALSINKPIIKPWGQTVSYIRCPNGTLVELCSPMSV
ncbi:MAG: hypothetical protein QM652_06015 [Legionella sp.]